LRPIISFMISVVPPRLGWTWLRRQSSRIPVHSRRMRVGVRDELIGYRARVQTVRVRRDHEFHG
jgi:hypothetical protein